mgnify:CR=1 FL=1
MERASLLIESGAAAGRRIDFLFNPAQVVLERVSGIRGRTLGGARLSGRGERDDPVVFTGGGETRITLKLLFDTTILEAPQTEPVQPGTLPPRLDVRQFTRPLWEMAEGAQDHRGPQKDLPRGRFLWGKAWNVPVAVMALSERLDRFEPDGTPLRSWVHIRFRRLAETPEELPWPDLGSLLSAGLRAMAFSQQLEAGPFTPSVLTIRHVVQEGDRLDRLAARYYGASWQWRLIAMANDLDDPGELPVGAELLIPAIEELPSTPTIEALPEPPEAETEAPSREPSPPTSTEARPSRGGTT